MPPCSRREYTVSETAPILVALKAHDGPSEPRFDFHYALELGVVLSGQMQRFNAGLSRSVGPGQVWLCSPWEPHGFCVSEPCRAVVVTIFPPALAHNGFPELQRLSWHEPFALSADVRPDVEGSHRIKLLELGKRLADSLELELPERLLVQRMLVYQVLLALPRGPEATAQEAISDEGWPRFNRAVELVFRKRCFVSTAEAARECGVSEKALDAFFRNAAGVSFPKLALRCRLQGAASQLLSTGDPVKAIGQDWGFSDVSHFHVAFRAGYGCSPVRYREQAGVVDPPESRVIKARSLRR